MERVECACGVYDRPYNNEEIPEGCNGEHHRGVFEAARGAGESYIVRTVCDGLHAVSERRVVLVWGMC